jgi:hypothetical protein
MPQTYEPIATTTLSTTTSTITFDSIPQTYTDLKVIVNNLSVGTGGYMGLRFNNNSTSNAYISNVLRANISAASATSDEGTILLLAYDGLSSDTIPAVHEIHVQSYTNNKHKSLLAAISADRNNAGFVYRTVGLWRNTAAITRIDLIAQNWNFTSGTTATVYGIKAA